MKVAVAGDDLLSASQLAERARERRAVEAAIWGMPLVSVDAMRQAFLRDAGGNYNDIVYLSRQADWNFQVTTPNASSWYVYIPIYLKNGPVVLEVPPAAGAGLFGNLNDAWQIPHADVGPAGEDGGQGGKYLVLPPDHTGPVPAGYVAVRFDTYNGYCFLRAIAASAVPTDVAKAIDLIKKTRVYALTDADSPPRQRFIDMSGKLFDGIAHCDDTFYDGLARMVDEEPLQLRDEVAVAHLRSIGIEKGKPFLPDIATREVLTHAVVEARAGFIQSTMALPGYWSGSQWAIPAPAIAAETGFTFDKDGRLDVDARAQVFFLGCAPAKRPGAATFYVAATKDRTGAPLDGDTTYRLHVPSRVPATQFWAVTVYDFETAAFVRDAPRVELNSYGVKMQKNADGSVEVFFGPAAPAGRKDNWIMTPHGKPWFALFRFYGPGMPLFEKTWKLPDIEPV
jgi:hypothetical protein